MKCPADHAREMGWGVGTILEGGPIVHQGRQVESGRVIVITAIGEQTVLAKRVDETWPETSWEFTSRDWREIGDERD